MDCKNFRDNIDMYFDKGLPDLAHSEMDTHIRECSQCSTLYNEYNLLFRYIEELKAIEPKPFAETRIQERINGYLEQRQKSPVKWVVRNLQPAVIGLAILVSVALGILIGIRGELKYTAHMPSDEQFESMRSDLNVPGFMDEETTSLN